MTKSEDVYLKCPIFLQKILFNRYAYKINKLKFQDDYYVKLQELEKNKLYSYSELQDSQLDKLKTMIIHCYHNVSYYRKLFDEIKLKASDITSLKDINLIPILTRNQVKNNMPSLIAGNISKNQMLIRNTSGTTGSPMYFFVDRLSYPINNAYIKRHWNWAGFNFGDRRITLQGRRIINRERAKPPFWMYNKWDKQLFFSTYHQSEELMPYFVDKLSDFSPQLIDAYPSAVYVLAKYMQSKKMKYKMKAVFTSSETLYPVQRETIERVFQCKVFDRYGLSEMFNIANECEYHNGLHLNLEYAITQIVDKHDEIVPTGAEGRVVCTGLENFSMPLIRYDTGDIGRIKSDKCSCGRNSPLMAPVTTKSEDQILTSEGRYISGSLLTFPFKPMKNIIKSQLVQDNINIVKVKIVRSRFYNNSDSEVLLEGLHKCLGENMQIVLEFVDEIERSKNGKYRWVISSVHKKLDFERDNV